MLLTMQGSHWRVIRAKKSPCEGWLRFLVKIMSPFNFEVALCRRPRIFSTCHLWKCQYRTRVYWNLWYPLLSILKVIFLESNPLQFQGSPHIVKTGPLSWLKDEVRENLGDFRKSIQISTFLSPLPHVPLPFTKRTCCTMILKRMQLTSLE